MAQNVRVINDMTLFNRTWLYLRVLSFVLIIVCFGLGILFACVSGGVQIGDNLESAINTMSSGLAAFISVMFFIGSVFFGFLVWLFNRLYLLDVKLPEKITEKLLKKLQNYEYRKLKRLAKTHKRWDNQKLKKQLKTEYKNNKQ